MNLFINEPNITDRDKHIMNVVFSLNRACNLRCHHCCLSNEYKANKDNMPMEYLERYCDILDGWLGVHQQDFDMISLLMSGAEISMLDDKKFVEYGERIYQQYKYLSKKYTSVVFEMIILSNLVLVSDAKKKWMKEIVYRAREEGFSISVATSYERYTNRFHKPEILSKWEENIQWFKAQDIKPVVIWAISKQDALDCQNIIEYLDNLGIDLFYVPLLPTGESSKNHDMVASYEDFEFFLRTLYAYPNVENLMLAQKKPYEYDKVINLILEQNGFIMMDLLQDLVVQYEANSNFNLNNEYISDDNKPIFVLENKEQDLESMCKFWKSYMKQERMYRIKSGCYNCKFFEYCLGGVHTFRPIYHQKDKCPGFKDFLEDMSQKDRKTILLKQV